MAIKLTADSVRRLLPYAPQQIVDAFATKQSILDMAGITEDEYRMAFFFANLSHETGGFTIRNLTESINYSHERAAQVWPSRFGSGADVARRFGSAPGWQLKMFDDVYGNRMGNRPGTNDGSRYIGRGGPQWTGREGYEALQRLTGLPAVDDPDVATKPELQPEISAAFWTWKDMNSIARADNFTAVVKRWNGGTIGMPDRERELARMLPIIRESGASADPNWRPELKIGARGQYVVELQQALGVANDGDFGPATERAVIDYQRTHGLEADGVVGPNTWQAIRAKAPEVKQPVQAGDPPWMRTMIEITGTLETPGAGDNPKILAWRDEIAQRYPDMAAYCREYTHDSIPWCGLTVAYVMAHNGIRPVFGPTDTDKFLWANAWAKFGRRLAEPQRGCVMVLTRAGGGHVTLLERIEGDYYVCRGGNQADAVNVARFHRSQFTCATWPEGFPS